MPLPAAARILIIEDEPRIVSVLTAYLEREGFEVMAAADGERGLALAMEERPSLVILDLMLPRLGGEEICARLRQVSDIPILILSARGTTQDRIFGLDIGADDYLSKPFSPAEVVARVKALLRRASSGAAPRGTAVMSFNGGYLILDDLSHEVRVRGQPVDLTPTEYSLLKVMASRPGQAFSRARLIEAALGYDHAAGDRTVDAHIKNLRRKIEPDGEQNLLQTVFGLGYRFGGTRDAS
ncbi:MAG: response regulator transcription factor [Bacteroidota bacterium]